MQSQLDWSMLARSFCWALLVAIWAVIPPYLTWLRYPAGNARGEDKKQRRSAKQAAKRARDAFPKDRGDYTQAWQAGELARQEDAERSAEIMAQRARHAAIREGLPAKEVEARAHTARERARNNALRPERDAGAVRREWRRMLGMELKGFSADWNLKDNWVSSLSLAAAVFTGVFTSTDTLGGIVGEGAKPTLVVIAVAAGLSAGLVGAGPIFLTIFKRRWVDDGGAAKHNTVLGVLVASIVVMTGVTGLVFTAATALGTGAVWAIAGATVGVLVIYSWKSVPQILADGSSPPKDVTSGTPLL